MLHYLILFDKNSELWNLYLSGRENGIRNCLYLFYNKIPEIFNIPNNNHQTFLRSKLFIECGPHVLHTQVDVAVRIMLTSSILIVLLKMFVWFCEFCVSYGIVWCCVSMFLFCLCDSILASKYFVPVTIWVSFWVYQAAPRSHVLSKDARIKPHSYLEHNYY